MATPDGSVIEEPQTIAERSANARHCKTALGLDAIPALVDTLENGADIAYDAWPDRLVVIDLDGRLAWLGESGPFGFKPGEMRAALLRELARQSGRERAKRPIAPESGSLEGGA